MGDTFLADLLSASNAQDLNVLIAANPDTADPSNWLPLESPLVEATAIQTLAITIHEALKSVISKRCRELGMDEVLICADPSVIRCTLYPEAAGWTTYAAIGQAAKAVRLAADGDRFATNLILSDEGLLENVPTKVPACLAFCELGSGLLSAFKNKLGFWEIVLFRTLPGSSGIACCKIATSSKIKFHRHPEATRIQKLFRYELPIGGRSVISKDLLDLIQQTIHDAIIPFSLQDQPGRYGYDRFLTKVSLGLDFKLRLSQKKQLTYLHSDTLNGKTVNIYLFKLRFERQHQQTTRNTLNQRYFKTNRHIVFLSQGMAIGELGADFIEFSAGLKHLRNHLLVSVAEAAEIEIESLKPMLASYLAGNEALQRMNKIYNEELTID